MQKTLFLHIGAVKAGSTSIQEFLLDRQMTSPDFLYFDAIQSCYLLNSLAKKCNYDKINRNTPYFQCDQNKLLSEIEAKLKTTIYDTIVISQENFSRIYRDEGVIEFAHGFFRKCSLNVKIIYYARRQDQWLESWYQEHVKQIESFTDSFSQWDYDKSACDHYRIIKLWERVFGKENIILRPFEKGQFYQQNLIKDFCHIIGINTSQQSMAIKKANTRLDIFSIELLRLFHIHGVNADEHQVILNSLIDLETGSSRLFSYMRISDRCKICSDYEQSNKQLTKDYLTHKNDPLFYESPDQMSNLLVFDQECELQFISSEIHMFVEQLRSGNFQSHREKKFVWPWSGNSASKLVARLEMLREKLILFTTQ